MKYDVWVSISASVEVDAKNEEEAEKKASVKIEKLFDKGNICLVGNVDCHNVKPGGKSLEQKREELDRAWEKLTGQKEYPVQ